MTLQEAEQSLKNVQAELEKTKAAMKGCDRETYQRLEFDVSFIESQIEMLEQTVREKQGEQIMRVTRF